MNYHYNNKAEEIKKPLEDDIEKVVCEWDYEFLNSLEFSLFKNLINAANYLNIKDLLELTAAKVAHMIKDKSVPEIRDMFDIVNDFTPEEEERIRKEDEWCLGPDA